MDHCPSCAATVTQLAQKFFNSYESEVHHPVQNSQLPFPILFKKYNKSINLRKLMSTKQAIYNSNFSMLELRLLVACPLPQRILFNPRLFHVGLVVDIEALGCNSLQILQFLCQYHSTNAPHSYFIHLSSTLNNLCR